MPAPQQNGACDLERRLRDYAANGCRPWTGIAAIFVEAADAIRAKDAALAPFAEMADEAEPYGEYAEVYLANAVSLSDCQAAREARARGDLR